MSAPLPLKQATGPAWLDAALADPIALLDDHANLERAAAANALHLLRTRPDHVPSDRWVERLTGVAREEVEHLAIVHRELVARGAQLSTGHTNPYAKALRELIRPGRTPGLVDRLLVSALIEARSCERFAILAGADFDLAWLYRDLAASEEGHYRLFLQLARLVDASSADDRWGELLDEEARIIAAEEPGPRMHAGW